MISGSTSHRPFNEEEWKAFFEKIFEAKGKSFAEIWPKSKPPITRLDFEDDHEKKRLIGKGKFAEVYMANSKILNEDVALKIMDKRKISSENYLKKIRIERRMLESLSFPNILECYLTYQTPMKCVIVLEYAPGGDLFNLIMQNKKLVSAHCPFYAAQLVITLEYLHSLDIMYRDLKPENCLLCSNGYIKLTDFSTARIYPERLRRELTKCSSPMYGAPEFFIVPRKYDHKVDWWSLGVLIYLMNAGFYPYTCPEDQILLFQKRGMSFPTHFSNRTTDLINNLCRYDPVYRYTAGETKKHEFFNLINWIRLYKQDLRAPYIPEAGTDHFPKCEPEEEVDGIFDEYLFQKF